MSSNDSDSASGIESNDRLVPSTSSLSNTDADTNTDTADEIDISKWTIFPTAKRDPFRFSGNREAQAYGAQILIKFWNYIFPRNMVQKIVYETNRYAETMCNTSNPRQQYSRINKWQPTSIEEFNIFLAILILQGIIRKPELQMYFTTDELLATPIFSKILTADLFLMLLKMLHFETDEGSDAKLKKIWAVIEGLGSSFKDYINPEDSYALTKVCICTRVVYRGNSLFLPKEHDLDSSSI
ncbi:unnamed protein product [Didymodactylos carnosus]|uniref:PiggyBac transposable element-derived protein domain-containing protein n=1 Tax=Didymodactylos carnosus TaxID=1234261 RepID=A0A815BKN6_9BILA|nr:unnamed protein product [Didymodactylos carnosus]CAF4065561.1 unnamed protein product [Didymodactylos carnosus]